MKLANPGIVIGLGGTGQWVLTYLKKNLLDTYGKVPDTVKLLAFDTTSSKSDASVLADKKADEPDEERAKVSKVILDVGEFVYLGGNIRKVCEEIRNEGKHEHISSWLQAEQYLEAFDYDAFQISKGAGQRRPFGRMAVFYDLATGVPQITGKLTQAITDVMNANRNRQPIEFYVITSIAGGTGSGMFIDIAHIARKLAERQGISFAVRGFIVLPNTFAPVINTSYILPNAFAAMRELDRFMLVFDKDYPIYYSESYREPHTLYHSIYKSKLFDSCYLLDSVRPNLTLQGVRPKEGVFPVVAECITALLDPATGDTFSQHYKNVNNQLAHAQAATNKAMYSSLGTYTYILPVEDIIQRNTLKAAIELLRDRLLKIEGHPHDERLCVSNAGNAESNQTPREASMSFLKKEMSREYIQNLHINQQIALVLESGRLQEQDYIADIAYMGIDMLGWILPTSQDNMVSQAHNIIQSVFNTSFVAEVPTSRIYKDGTPEAAGRIKQRISQMREKILGREDSTGRRSNGELQKGLAVYQQRNVEQFRKLLIESVHDILNGVSPNPLISKVGKLPYARDFTKWLSKQLEEFNTFMWEVLKVRAESGELALAREDALNAKQMMDDTRKLTGPIDRLRGTAVKAQEAYIGAENYLLDLERQEVLLQSVVSTVEALRNVTLELKAQCNQWLNVLALGGVVEDDERIREIGVYRKLMHEQGEHQRRREEQASIKVYKYLSGPGSQANPTDDYRYEDTLYDRLISENWPEILRRFTWDITYRYGKLRVHFKYGEDELLFEHNRQTSATDINTRFLLEKLRPYFLDVRKESIADRMASAFTAQHAAKELLDNSGALIAYEANEQKYAERHNFVCVNRGRQVAYFDQFQSELRASAPNDKDNQVVGLSNKHRCVVISTVDLLINEATAPYHSARRAYLGYAGVRTMSHIFPAEVNASTYEKRFPQPPLMESERLFSPDLVALLEDPKMVRRFVLALFYGMIRREEVPDNRRGQKHYVLRLGRTNRHDQASTIRLTRPSPAPQLLDAMTTIVYPRITPETGKREIYDVTPGSAVRVSPSRIDEALRLYEDSITSGDKGGLAKRFERFLEQDLRVIGKHNSGSSQWRDIRAIIYLVLWDELVALEKTDVGIRELTEKLGASDLDGIASRFLRQAGFDIKSSTVNGLYRCSPNTRALQRLLPDVVYTRIWDEESVDDTCVLNIQKEVKQISPGSKFVLVITNQQTTDEGWAQIGTLGIKSFKFLPVEQTVISQGLAEGQEKELLRQELEKRLGEDYDPYNVRDPVSGAFSFFGRDALVENLLRRMRDGRPVAILGLRKLGKTSLLHALSDRAPFPVASVNLQKEVHTDLVNLYQRVLDSWQQWVRVHYDFIWDPPFIESDDPTPVFTSATLDLLAQLKSVTDEVRLGILLDEIESIVPYLDGNGPDLARYLTFMRALRSLIDERYPISLVVASLNRSVKDINAWGAEQNPMFSLLQTVYLPPLTYTDCIQMIRNIGRQVGLVYDDASVVAIAGLSGGHPFLARQFCSLLYKRRGRQPGEITIEAIPATTHRFVRDNDLALPLLDAGIWQEAGKAVLWGEVQAQCNQHILLELAQADNPLTEQVLLAGSDKKRRETALIDLEHVHFIYQPDPGYYALRYGLLRTWLRDDKLGLE
jgi:hypothetical protein